MHAIVPASSATTKVNRKINTFGINILTIVWNNLFEQLWNNIHSSYITDTSYSSIFSASEFKSYQSAVLCIHKARLFRPNKCKDKWIWLTKLYSVVPSITKKERMELKKNVEDQFPTIFCMTFVLYNCIRKQPCKRKLREKLLQNYFKVGRNMCYSFAIVQ